MRTQRVLAVLLLVVSLTGCAARQQQITNLPPNVTLTEVQQWDTAVANLQKVASVVSTVRQSVIAANKGGVFPDGVPYATTLTILGKIDQLQLAASNVLKQAPNNFSDTTKLQIKDYMQQISAQILQLNTEGLTGIKNPTSQQQIAALITEVSAAVALILSL